MLLPSWIQFVYITTYFMVTLSDYMSRCALLMLLLLFMYQDKPASWLHIQLKCSSSVPQLNVHMQTHMHAQHKLVVFTPTHIHPHTHPMTHLMCAAHSINVLCISEEQLKLKHLVQPALPLLPHLLQMDTLPFEVWQTVTDLWQVYVCRSYI